MISSDSSLRCLLHIQRLHLRRLRLVISFLLVVSVLVDLELCTLACIFGGSNPRGVTEANLRTECRDTGGPVVGY